MSKSQSIIFPFCYIDGYQREIQEERSKRKAVEQKLTDCIGVYNAFYLSNFPLSQLML